MRAMHACVPLACAHPSSAGSARQHKETLSHACSAQRQHLKVALVPAEACGMARCRARRLPNSRRARLCAKGTARLNPRKVPSPWNDAPGAAGAEWRGMAEVGPLAAARRRQRAGKAHGVDLTALRSLRHVCRRAGRSRKAATKLAELAELTDGCARSRCCSVAPGGSTGDLTLCRRCRPSARAAGQPRHFRRRASWHRQHDKARSCSECDRGRFLGTCGLLRCSFARPLNMPLAGARQRQLPVNPPPAGLGQSIANCYTVAALPRWAAAKYGK